MSKVQSPELKLMIPVNDEYWWTSEAFSDTLQSLTHVSTESRVVNLFFVSFGSGLQWKSIVVMFLWR